MSTPARPPLSVPQTLLEEVEHGAAGIHDRAGNITKHHSGTRFNSSALAPPVRCGTRTGPSKIPAEFSASSPKRRTCFARRSRLSHPQQHYVLALSCEVSCADSFHGLKFDRYFLAHLRAHPMRQPRRATLERAAGNGAQQGPSYPCSIRPAGEKLSSFVLPEHLLRATTTGKNNSCLDFSGQPVVCAPKANRAHKSARAR